MISKQELSTLRRESSKGIKWQTASEIFIRIFQFLTTIVLARLLMPEHFGLIAIALIFSQLAFVIFDFGFSAALIQKKELQAIHYSTTFVVYLILAVFFMALVVLIAPLAANYFRQPILADMLRLLSVIFIFYALSAIPSIKLTRSMWFKRFSGLQFIAALSYGFTAIILAWLGWGVWSFVYGLLMERFILMLLLFLFAPRNPGLRFNGAVFKELMGFGGNVMASRFASYVNNNTPSFMIGKVLGAVQLGFFSLAYQLVEFPVQRIAKNILRVLFPAFSKLQDDLPQFRELFAQTVYYLSLFTFPVFGGLLLIAPQLIHLFYGSKWDEAILPLQILTAVGLFRSLWVMNSVIFLSRGKPKIEFQINLFYALFLIPGIYLAARNNLQTVAAMLAVGMLLILVIGQIRAFRLIELNYAVFFKAVGKPALGTVSFLGINYFLYFLGLKYSSDVLQLSVYFLSSVIIYGLIILYLDRTIINRIKSFLSS